MIRRTGIKIQIRPHKWGFTYVCKPTSRAHNAAIAKYLAGYGEKWTGVFIQTHEEYMSMIDHYDLTPAMCSELEHGYTITRIVDPWIFLTHVGYNAADDCQL